MKTLSTHTSGCPLCGSRRVGMSQRLEMPRGYVWYRRCPDCGWRVDAEALRQAERLAGGGPGELFAVVAGVGRQDVVSVADMLRRQIDPSRVMAWAHPHGTPAISHAAMVAVYAEYLAQDRAREAVA